METIDLIKKLEIISSKSPNRVLRIEGIFIDNKEFIEVLIFKGFSSSTTHKIEHDLEKNIIAEYFQRCFGEDLPESTVNIKV